MNIYQIGLNSLSYNYLMKLYNYHFDYDFKNINKALSKLEKSLSFSKIYSKEIISNEGSFYLKNNKYYKKNINYNTFSSEIHLDLFDKIVSPLKPIILYQQRGGNTFFYTKEEVFQIPIDHIFLIIEKKKFSIHKNSSTHLIIEYHNNKIQDIYFTSEFDIDNISAIQDISYIMNIIV